MFTIYNSQFYSSYASIATNLQQITLLARLLLFQIYLAYVILAIDATLIERYVHGHYRLHRIIDLTLTNEVSLSMIVVL